MIELDQGGYRVAGRAESGSEDSCGGGVPFRQTTQPLPPGQHSCALHRRTGRKPGTDIKAQIDVLAHALGVALKGAPVDPESLDQSAYRQIRTLIPGMAAHDDDVTLLLVGLPRSDEKGSCV
ncbi:hypothetical protein [Streptomyces sp. NPDC101165]|uniref:hypothetical protein n=1 Tax=Streptomyces sp. NPDC101165 TaxID=3366119 RepID=UPI0037F6ED8B